MILKVGDMMNEEKKRRKGLIAKISGIVLGLVLVLGISYAIFRTSDIAEKTNRIHTADFNVIIENESEEGIHIENAYPITDKEGLQSTYYEFDVTNTGTLSAKYTLTLQVPDTTTLNAKAVKYNLIEDGEEITITPTLLGNKVKTTDQTKTLYKIDTDVILPEESKHYKLQMWMDYDATVEDTNKTLEAKVRVDAEQFTGGNPYKEGTIAYEVLNNNKIVDEATSKGFKAFDANTEASGLYGYQDANGGKTYYFRGNVENNYVSFAGKTWRIVRITEDGSAKMILDAGVYGRGMSYNKLNNDPKYVNYSGSNAERIVNDWYKTNLNVYDAYIKTSTYCNDKRENPENPLTKFILSANSQMKNVYGIYSRGYVKDFDMEDKEEILNSLTLTPNLSCEESDQVKTKIALLTADEYILAGGGLSLSGVETSSNYLNNQNWWWTMSPAYFDTQARVFTVSTTGSLGEEHVANGTDPDIRPVISLKTNASILSGDGSLSNPYTIE